MALKYKNTHTHNTVCFTAVTVYGRYFKLKLLSHFTAFPKNRAFITEWILGLVGEKQSENFVPRITEVVILTTKKMMLNSNGGMPGCQATRIIYIRFDMMVVQHEAERARCDCSIKT